MRQGVGRTSQIAIKTGNVGVLWAPIFERVTHVAQANLKLTTYVANNNSKLQSPYIHTLSAGTT